MFLYTRHYYMGIIGDIKNSKKIVDRRAVQMKLNRILEEINHKYAKEIAAKFIITLGDEFQGLLYSGESVIDIIEEIQRTMYPVEIRFGIGIGEITTDINKEMAIGADGPAYYKAREAVEKLKNNEKKNKRQFSDVWIEMEENDNSITLMLNTIFSLMAVIRENWTERQREIIWEFDGNSDSQMECAKKMNISQSSVQRALNNGDYYAYRNAKDTVNEVLKGIGELHV